MLFEYRPEKPDNRVKMTVTEAQVFNGLAKTGHLGKILAGLKVREGGTETDLIGLMLAQMRAVERQGRTSMGDIRGEGSSISSRVAELINLELDVAETSTDKKLKDMGRLSHEVAAFGAGLDQAETPQLELGFGQMQLDLSLPDAEVLFDNDGEWFGVADKIGQTISPAFSTFEAFIGKRNQLQREIDELKRLSAILWPKPYRKLNAMIDTSLDEFAALSTILNWIAIEKVKGGMPDTCLVEKVLSPWARLGLGRIDRLNSKELIYGAKTVAESIRISRITNLRRTEIVDWKVREGDGKKRRFLDLTNTPQPEDLFQDGLYKLGVSMAPVMFGDTKVWNPENCPTGRLIYFMAGQVHEVRTDVGSLLDFFKEGVVEQMPKIDFRREVREGSNALLEVLRQLFGKSARRPRSSAQTATQSTIFPMSEEDSVFSKLLDEHRDWTGRGQMIQRLKTGKLILHMRRVRQAHEAKKIRLGAKFDFERGGYIHCPLCSVESIQDGVIPSFHIRVDDGFFHCFRCTNSGRVADERGSVIPRSNRNFTLEGERPMVTGDDEDAYATLHEFFTKAFEGSIAQKYLLQTRGMSAKRAFRYGAGYGGNSGTFPGLDKLWWDKGYRLDELVNLGIIGFSEHAESSPLIAVLRDWGLGESELARPRELRSERKTTVYPYWTLEGRVTFPIRSVTRPLAPVWGFYGRSVLAARGTAAKHRIVMPQEATRGLFNVPALSDALAMGQLEQVYIAKGVFEAIVLERLGYTPAVSILERMPNHALQQIVRLNPREIRLALGFGDDIDEVQTKFKERLTKMGYTGRIDCFSSTFAAEHPEVGEHGFEDFSAWWMGSGRMNRRKKKVVEP